MAKKSKKRTAVSLRPDEMVAGGLPSDFDGAIERIVFTAYDYDGKADEPVLVAAVDIVPDDDNEDDIDPFTAYYSAGRLNDFVPSKDGEEPCDLDSDDEEDWEGPYIVPVGRKEALNKSTNWAHFSDCLIEAGFDIDSVTDSAECFDGTRGRFNRIPQKKRPGVQDDDEEEQQRRDILVVTEVYEEKASKKKSSKKSSKKTKTKDEEPEEEAGDEDLDEKIVEIILEGLEAAGGELKKSKVPNLVMKAIKDKKERGVAVKRASDPEFLAECDDHFLFEADENTLYQYEEEDED